MNSSTKNVFCKKCRLHEKAVHPMILGRGNPSASVLLLGEAPGCFTNDTFLITESGSFSINSDSAGLHTIDSQEILNNLEYSVKEFPMMSFKVIKYPTTICTLNHRVLVSYRNTYLKNKLPQHLSNPTWLSIEEVAELYNKGYQVFTLVPKLKYSCNEKLILDIKKHKKYGKRSIDKIIKDFIEIDSNIAFLFGSYLGDGFSNFKAGTVAITISKGYKETFIEVISEGFRKFGVTPTIKYEKIGKVIKISVYSRTLCELFLDLFGKDCYTKVIPKILFTANKKVISSFLFGWYVTDGKKGKELKRGKSISSVSQKAIWDGVALGLRYGVLLGVQRNKSKKVTEADYFNLTFNSSSIKQLQWNIDSSKEVSPHYGEDNDYYYLKITEMQSSVYTGTIYDKTTQRHSYHIPFIVHNSTEDKEGQVFIGKSGQLLQNKVNLVELDCFVSNSVLCRPTDKAGGNATPTTTQIECCKPTTIDLILTMKPRVVVALGAIAMQQLLDFNLNMEIARGKEFYHTVLDTTIIPTYHPAYLLRTNDTRFMKEFTDDLALAKRVSNKPRSRRILSVPVSYKDRFDIEKYFNELKQSESFSVDLETTSLNPKKGRITDISFCNSAGRGVHIEWKYLTDRSDLLNLLKEVLEAPAEKAFHNADFDIRFLRSVGFTVPGKIFDTMLAYHTMTMSYEGGKSASLYKLKTMAWYMTQEGGYEDILDDHGGIVGIQKDDKKKKNDVEQGTLFDDTELASAAGFDPEYNARLVYCSTYIKSIKEEKLKALGLGRKACYSAMDADVTFRIYKYLRQTIDTLYSYPFYNITMPLCKVLIRVHENGIMIDVPYIDKMIEENNIMAESVKTDFFKEAKYEFNINSVDQLREFMYTKLKLQVNNKYLTTKGKQPSTDEEAITFFSDKKPILKKILEYRGVNKQTSTYFEGYKKLVDENSRVYPNYLQIGTASNRLSCVNPNLQNIPRDNRVRNIIIASPGHKICIADLSQIELRLLAMISGDTNMINAFKSGHDFHTYTACSMFGIPLDKFDKKIPEHANKRDAAKTINFGIVYQQRAESLAEALGISLDKAKAFMKSFFDAYPKVSEWVIYIKAFARANGYVETIYGRRRYLPDIKSSDDFVRESAERRAVNSPIQSCLHFDTMIPTKSGYMKIGSLVDKNVDVLVHNKLRKAKGMYSGKKKTYRYYFSDGTSIIATKDHRFKILTEGMQEVWKEIGKLTGADFIIAFTENNKSKYQNISLSKSYCNKGLKKHEFDLTVKITEDIGFVLGLMIGNGSFNKTRGASCCFNHEDMDIAQRMVTIMNKTFDTNVSVCFNKKENYEDVLRVVLNHQVVATFFDKCGLRRVTARYKRIPDIIWCSPPSVICSFLSGMFTTDGSVNRDGASYTTTSKELAYEFGNMLHMVGLRSNIVRRADKAFNICVNKDFEKFEATIGFASKRKKDMANKYYHYKDNRRKSCLSDLPYWLSYNIVCVGNIASARNKRSLQVIRCRTKNKKRSLSRETALCFESKSKEFKFLKKGRYLKTVVHKEYFGISDIFDLTMLEGKPQFSANGSLVHNSAGDVCFIGLIRFQDWLDTNNRKTRIIGTVHDSILTEAPYDEVDEVTVVLPKIMTTDIPRITIDIKADVDVLDKWKK